MLSFGAGLDVSSLCSNMAGVVQFIGYALLIIKIAIPLLIIFYGVLDFGKAVVSEKEDDIKKYGKRLLFRVIAGIAIFLVPNVVLWLFGLNKDYATERDQVNFEQCENCFLKPWSCEVND